MRNALIILVVGFQLALAGFAYAVLREATTIHMHTVDCWDH